MKLNNIIENIIVVLHILHIRMNNKTKNRGDPLFLCIYAVHGRRV